MLTKIQEHLFLSYVNDSVVPFRVLSTIGFLEHIASVRQLRNGQVSEWPHKYYSNCNPEIWCLMFNFAIFTTVRINEK